MSYTGSGELIHILDTEEKKNKFFELINTHIKTYDQFHNNNVKLFKWLNTFNKFTKFILEHNIIPTTYYNNWAYNFLLKARNEKSENTLHPMKNTLMDELFGMGWNNKLDIM
ncbi:MAG: hypothetical protein KIT69_15525, partial [Propionibacteriaceae bacterium]|nr:hypothetical protein [Propionibacteriaceae bacterium]